MPPNLPHCVDMENSFRNSASLLTDPDAEMYHQLGVVPMDIKINPSVFDTSFLFALPILGTVNSLEAQVAAGKELAVLKKIKIRTSLLASQKVMDILINKFGKPTNQGCTEWLDQQNGNVVDKTQTANWKLPEITVNFQAEAPSSLTNGRGKMGLIEIYATDFINQIEMFKENNKPAPKRGM